MADLLILAALFGLVWFVLSRLVVQSYELTDQSAGRLALLRSVLTCLIVGVGGAALISRAVDLGLPRFLGQTVTHFDLALLSLTLMGLLCVAGFYIVLSGAPDALPFGLQVSAIIWWLVLAIGYAGAGLVLATRRQITGISTRAGGLAAQVAALQDDLDSVHSRDNRRRLAIPHGSSVRYLRIVDIESIFSQGNYVALLTDGHEELWRGSLTQFLTQHGKTMLRISRSAAVSPEHVASFERKPSGGATLALRSGARLDVSQRMAASVAAALGPVR